MEPSFVVASCVRDSINGEKIQRHGEEPTRKRIKEKEEEEPVGVDRISQLPDSILSHVLSFMSMEETIPLSLLSKRWKHLWVHTPRLDFTSPDPWRSDRTGTTAGFVDRCLALHRRPKIASFRVSILAIPSDGYRTAGARQIDSWLSFAVRRGVEVLCLDCAGDAAFLAELDELGNFYSLPRCLFECHTLVSMTLQCCHLNLPPDPFCFSSLRAVELNRLTVGDDELRTLISNCPLLERLQLRFCNYESDLLVSAGGNSRLRTLEITDCCADRFSNLVMEIYAPRVTSLTIDRGLSTRRYHVIHLASVKTVSFDPKQAPVEYNPSFNVGAYSKSYADFLQQISHARKLDLCRWSIQILSVVEVQCSRLPFSAKATTLILNMGFKKWEIPGVGYILSCFNRVEDLIVNVQDGRSTLKLDDAFLSRYNFQERSYWELSKSSFQISLQNLKTITIHHLGEYGERESSLEDSIQSQEREIDFLAFILKKSSFLECLTIQFQRCYIESEKFQHLFPQFASRLVGLQRASKRARVIMNMS